MGIVVRVRRDSAEPSGVGRAPAEPCLDNIVRKQLLKVVGVWNIRDRVSNRDPCPSLGVCGDLLRLAGTIEKETPPVLRDTVVSGIQNSVILDDLVSGSFERPDQLDEEFPVLSQCEATDVFEDEVPRLQFYDDPDELLDQ